MIKSDKDSKRLSFNTTDAIPFVGIDLLIGQSLFQIRLFAKISGNPACLIAGSAGCADISANLDLSG